MGDQEASTELLAGALETVVSRECHAVGIHLLDRVTQLQMNVSGPEFAGTRYFTWRPCRSVFFAISRDESADTVLYCYSNQRSYYAAPGAMLPPSVPCQTVFLAQYVEDGQDFGHERVPRLLVYDVAILDGVCLDGVSAQQRYASLRSCLSGIASRTGDSSSLLCVQWVGEYSCSDAVVAGRMNLPHEIESLLVFSDQLVCSMDVVPVCGGLIC